LRQAVAALQAEGQRHVRSTDRLQVTVVEPPGPCGVCGGVQRVQKTVTRQGATLEHGRFVARETVYVCAAGCRVGAARVTHRARALSQRLPPRATVGYDVIAYIGRARFVDFRQREEIRTALAQEHGLLLSAGEVSTLSRRFLGYLAALHEARAPDLRAALAQDGGWPLHIDATGEGGRGTLLVAYTSWRHWVLGAWKVPTERADVIQPRLQQVVDRFGAPCALMRDLGRAVTDAGAGLVAKLGHPVPVLGCHLHFLRDVGSDLLREAHDHLRELFRRFNVRAELRALARDLGRALGPDIHAARVAVTGWQSERETGHVLPAGLAGLATVRALAQWVLDYQTEGADQGFPFDQPYLDLYDRCRIASRAVDAFRRRPIDDPGVRKALDRLQRLLHPVDSQVPFARVAATLQARVAHFTELRTALRLRPEPTHGRTQASPVLCPEQAVAELQDIQAAVVKLTASLAERRPARGPAQPQRQAIDLVLAHLRRHGHSLFGHAIPLPDGSLRLVDRTNNSLEGLFDELKHGERRRSGRKVLTQDLEQLPPAALLATNLRSPDYVAIICGSLDQLPRAFAELDAPSRCHSTVVARDKARLAKTTDSDVVSASLPIEDRVIIRSENMDRRLQAAARSRAPRS
jgi:hypothetical protein